MAAGLGYKEFTTGDVLTAADANGYLASQVVMVFASAAARTSAIASPQEGMIAYLKDTNAVEKYDGAAWVSVGGGGGGKVLQVVSATTTTSVTIATTTFTDSGLSATITPTLATSKILILTTQPIFATAAAATINTGQRLMRDATVISDYAPSKYESFSFTGTGASAIAMRSLQSISYLDSPSTTSATTYKTQGALNSTANSAALIYQETSSKASIVLMEIGV
jgi:hypothetical protein